MEAFAGATSFYVPNERPSQAKDPFSAQEASVSSAPALPTGPPTAFRPETKRTPSTWELQSPLQGEPGQTALAGVVLDLQAHPLANISLSINEKDGRRLVQTDSTGRFLLPLSEMGNQILVIDGRNAAHPGKAYGLFEVKVDVQAGRTTVLPYTIWLPDLDMAHAVTIPMPTETEVVITNPQLPGLELHIPPRTTIKDHEGNLVTQISMTAIPVDRPPFPLPPAADVPVYFTIQPGGAKLENLSWEGARLIYPNSYKEPPGTSVDFYNYDPKEKGWYIYGQGAVSQDGKRVIPGPNVALWEFTGAMLANPAFAPGTSPTGTTKGGDPVDLATGLFVMQKTDLAVYDSVMPIALTRTYRPNDARSRAFGIGASHPYDIFLVGSTHPYTYADLILADGTRYHFPRISPGTDFGDAVYEHTETQSPFYKAQIMWNNSTLGWNLLLRDGGGFDFPDGELATSPTGAAVRYMLDRNLNRTTFIRDANKNLQTIISPDGRTINFTYDTSNRITQAKDHAGRIVTYSYDKSGRLSSVTDPLGNSTSYTYDTSHRMLTITDPKRIKYLTNVYDANGRVTKQTQADATTYQFAYTLDANGKVTRTDVTDPRGTIRRVDFNAAGYPLSDIRALGKPEQQTTTYERDPATNFLLSRTDALGRKTTFTYDSLGRMLSRTSMFGTPEAVTTSMTYTPSYNRLLTVTDPLNHTTTFEYDSEFLGNVVHITNAMNKTTTLAYTPVGLYNTPGGFLQSVTDPLNHTTTFSYEDGDLISTTDALGRTTTRSTDALGRVLSFTSALNTKTQYEYDMLSQLTKTTDPLNGVNISTFDPNGNLLTVKDPKNQTTTYTYDNMNRTATTKDPLLKTESYLYDANGNLTKLTDRKAQITNYTYDTLDRRTKTTFHDNTSINFTYDAGNRLTQIQEKNAAGAITSTITRTYDNLDRLTREVTPQGTIDYTYDAASRRTSMTVAGQLAVNYVYDDANRMTQITQGTSTVTFAYDDVDRRTNVTYSNGNGIDFAYDAANQLAALTYKQGTSSIGTLTYAYDVRGNRQVLGGAWARTNLPPVLSTTIYNANNQQTKFGTNTLTYDANGNLSTVTDATGTSTYTWNVRNKLTGIMATGLSASFSYDALGRRIGKTVQGVTTNYLYDGINQVQEKNGSTVTANLLTGTGIDEFLTRTDGTGTKALLGDGLGSTVAQDDGTGALPTQYTYEPFGYTSVLGQASSNPYKYTGREDDDTGLYYYRARYYSPRLQRFISEDPILAPFTPLNVSLCTLNKTMWLVSARIRVPQSDMTQSLNAFSYALNNPVLRRDPRGLDPKDPDQCALGYGIVCLTLLDVASGFSADQGLGPVAQCMLPRLDPGTYRGKPSDSPIPGAAADLSSAVMNCLSTAAIPQLSSVPKPYCDAAEVGRICSR
jgi:RHS repeat-associated protein